KANEYLAALSKLIRQNMENLQFSLIPVDKELSLIANYINLQNLRFEHRIRLNMNNRLPAAAEVYIPPLLIHTFVENAIVHGLRKDIPQFVIDIDIRMVAGHLLISIVDNGPGFNKTQKDYRHLHDKTSMGIGIIRKRI